MFNVMTDVMTDVMDIKTNETSKGLIYHKWLHNDSFETLDTFKKFNNWLSGEFTLYLQDEDECNGLTIFFPNGQLSIKQLKTNKSPIEFKIEIKSKCLKSGIKIFNQVTSILSHLKDFILKN